MLFACHTENSVLRRKMAVRLSLLYNNHSATLERNKIMMTPRNGLLVWCGLSMLAFTLFQRAGIQPALAVSALVAGVLTGWLVGSGEWRAMGKDLIGALIVLVCLLFGTAMPLLSIIKMDQSLWLVLALLGLPVGYLLSRRLLPVGANQP